MTVATDTKVCTVCGKAQPLDEFYPHPRGKLGRQSRCRSCDNARPRFVTPMRVARVRGRHRATRELIRRYDAEFRDLLDYYTKVAQEEFDAIKLRAAVAQAEKLQNRQTAELPRLKPGPARTGESVLDRVDDRERCHVCREAHDRGHICPNCGAASDTTMPGRPAFPADDAETVGVPTVGVCSCGHPSRRHADGLCVVCDECTGLDLAAAS